MTRLPTTTLRELKADKFDLGCVSEASPLIATGEAQITSDKPVLGGSRRYTPQPAAVAPRPKTELELVGERLVEFIREHQGVVEADLHLLADLAVVLGTELKLELPSFDAIEDDASRRETNRPTVDPGVIMAAVPRDILHGLVAVSVASARLLVNRKLMEDDRVRHYEIAAPDIDSLMSNMRRLPRELVQAMTVAAWSIVPEVQLPNGPLVSLSG